MFKVVGIETGKVYVEGEYRNDGLRKLQEKYPYKRGDRNKNQVSHDAIYPEPLRMVRV